MDNGETPSEKAASALTEPLTTTIKKIHNQVLLFAIAFGIILAYVALSGRLNYETGAVIVVVFALALVAYVGSRRGSPSPPGRVTSTTELQEYVAWEVPKEMFLPDPLKVLQLRTSTKALRFTVPVNVSSNRSLWVFVRIWSNFQSIVFIPDIPLRVWSWRSFRCQPVRTLLNDARILQTVGGGKIEELEFHGWYRIGFAVTDSTLRNKLPLNYQVFASSDQKHWEDMSGPRTIYVTLVSDESKAKELLGVR
jgi:hypothetical protein